MSQFDVYVNTDKDTRKAYPYFVDVQNGLLDALNSVLAIPLTPVTKSDTFYPHNLCPILKMEEKEFALLTHQMASIARKDLGRPVCNASHLRSEVIAAIDLLVTGI